MRTILVKDQELVKVWVKQLFESPSPFSTLLEFVPLEPVLSVEVDGCPAPAAVDDFVLLEGFEDSNNPNPTVDRHSTATTNSALIFKAPDSFISITSIIQEVRDTRTGNRRSRVSSSMYIINLEQPQRTLFILYSHGMSD